MTERISLSDKNYIPVLDLIRGLAALGVGICHLLMPVMKMFPEWYFSKNIYPLSVMGFFSVEVFFALSGILLGPILYNLFNDFSYKKIGIFLARRWIRTLPTYYLGIILFIGLFVLIDKEMPDILPFLVFLQFPISIEVETLFFLSSWSLSVEEIFYVVFPLLSVLGFLLLRDKNKAFILALCCICMFSIGMRQIQILDFSRWEHELRYGAFLRLDAIAYGALLGIFFSNVSIPQFKTALIINFVFLCYLFIGWGFITNTLWHQAALSLMFVLVPACFAVTVLHLKENIKLKPRRIYKFLGDISYPFYVIHFPIFFVVFLSAEFNQVKNNIPLSCLIILFVFGITIYFSYLVYAYYEKFFLKFRPTNKP